VSSCILYNYELWAKCDPWEKSCAAAISIDWLFGRHRPWCRVASDDSCGLPWSSRWSWCKSVPPWTLHPHLDTPLHVYHRLRTSIQTHHWHNV